MTAVCRPLVLDRASIAEAIESACIAELDALKPGNVSVYSAGHGMSVGNFVLSARAIAPVLATPGLSVGERILAAIHATRRVVSCNTNLGIVLLCAPLAQAALNLVPGQALREALGETLKALDENDTRLTYQAIRLANPGGLGEVAQHDVRGRAPQMSLLQVMHTARRHDRIAQQYVSNYEDIFGIAVPRLYDGIARWNSEKWSIVSTYLSLLEVLPDTHITRKHGLRLAQDVSARAKRLNDLLNEEKEAPQLLVAPLMRFDAELKQMGINPGTSADLTVASLVVKRLQNVLQDLGHTPTHGRGACSGCCSSGVSLTAT